MAQPNTKHENPSYQESQTKIQSQHEQRKGPLATIVDPISSTLSKGLAPLGGALGTITKPIGDTVGSMTKPVLGPVVGSNQEKMEILGGNNRDSYEHGKDSLGGQVQKADNPLGLDQSGKWGFKE